ncbi:hypothetical protein [Escherichia coli]|uniref:hypothetical protein n=2 Tax=Escherichia coli TaxID=562 RepID=UPI00082720C2|nr:hypothetical protein [Escherichia coli]MDU9626264.1 hypothetical protein [Escherichia coli]
MSTITREQLRERAREKVKSLEFAVTQTAFADSRAELEEELELARIALASLEAEAVAWLLSGGGAKNHVSFDSGNAYADPLREVTPLYTAPPAPVSVPDDIDTRMKNAGMLSAPEIIAGQPIDAFMKHAGVVDLESLLKWSEMRRAEFLRMQAKYELGDNQKDDMYEWVISHVAAFSELHVNIRAAMLQGAEPVTTACKLRDAVEIIRNSGIAIDAEKILAERDALNAPDCWCRTCRPVTMTDMRFVVCPECGNKRCPHANDHRNACTGSNEPGQEGSAYPAAPQQEVK